MALFDEKEGYYQSQRPIMGVKILSLHEMSHLFAQALDEWLSSSIQSEGIRKSLS